jgi:antitoxin ParD1/3/4
MKKIKLWLPETYIKALDQLVEEKFYPNRSEVIRTAIRDLISSEVWRRKASIKYRHQKSGNEQ